ncbi:MAG: arginase family protein [Sphingobacteriales bacterium]|nr:arginase family protein [Sphingobacteriales bacterium]
MKHFKFYSKADILSLTRIRRFETKLGERIASVKNPANFSESLLASPCKYVLVGIPEDIGVRANLGTGGADTAWLPFLHSFLNLQSNDFFSGEEMMLLGHFDFGDIKFLIDQNAYNQEEKVDAYRHAVNVIDEEVEKMLKEIAFAGKIPVVIGGGHNNAYPIIKGVAKGLFKAEKIQLAQINSINLDAQADFRPLEGRHSGNAFKYAEDEGFLGKYAIIGLHENYINQSVLMEIHENPFIQYITYEDIFIHERKNFIQAVAHATGFTEDSFTGIELDVDCIEKVLSSALTPSGISTLHARQYINFTATDCKTAYLFISEGACQLIDGRKDDSTGKLISYLVSDFIKAQTRVNN